MAENEEFGGTERFHLVRRIGSGGMGVVYEALDQERSASVALKTLRTFTAEALVRFKNEFRALADLHHANLVTLGELVEHQGHWFFTMELVPGVDFLRWVRPGAQAPQTTTVIETPRPRPEEEDTALLRRGPEGSDSGSRARRAAPLTVDAQPAPRARSSIGPRLDEARLRAALKQLAQGVCALHAAGKVHRDLKPSNILVTGEGRLVILDFGLVADAEAPGREQPPSGKVIGTVAFMAPEQAAQRAVGPAADWYSVGVVLYLALTGRLPFDGGPEEILQLKQKVDPLPPLALCPDVPRDLDLLCVDLLQIDPARRPSAPEILARLDVAEAQLPPQRAPFVGRTRELGQLEEAFDEARAHGARTVFVLGESGVGKSALAQRFVEDLQRRQPNVVMLTGRCYERESVPYKALDGIVDELARFMDGLPKLEAAMLLPRKAHLLRQVFPQLGRVEVVAEQSGAPFPVDGKGGVEPHELRLQVFAALRELFARLCDRHPVIAVIDDLQWADEDSLQLLEEVLRPPDAPALLLVATVRAAPDGKEPPPALAPSGAIPFGVAHGHAREIRLSGLPMEEARALADLLLEDAPGRAAAIASEARGHPLFISELCRQRAAGTQADRLGPLRLEDALWLRIESLAPPARRLVEAVAIAGSPLVQSTAAEVAELELGDFQREVAALRAAHLVRTRGGRTSDVIEPYHDRVRQAVLARLPPEARRAWHARLGRALEAAGPNDLEALAAHFRGAGDLARAADYSARAGAQAAEALAFDRAARLYKLALELDPPDGERARALHLRLGEALSRAGRGPAAAEAFHAAAQLSAGAAALELRRRAAQHLLFSGHIDAGLRDLERVLDGLGLRLPRSPRRALASLLLLRARIRLRGLRFRERPADALPPEALGRVDAFYSIATGLSLVDIIRGAELQARHILLALETGEPMRLARALALESTFASSRGTRGTERAEQLLSTARALAERSGSPLAQAWVVGSAGFNAVQTGRWRAAHDRLAEAEELLRERCTGVGWELATVQAHRLFALALLGRLRELAERGRRYLREAEDRDDRYATTLMRLGPLVSTWLAAGDPAGGLRDADEALREWSRVGFHLQHFYGVTARMQYALFLGNAEGALRILEAARPELERSLLLRFQINRLAIRDHIGRAALAAAVFAPPSEKRALFHRVDVSARAILRERMAWATPQAIALLAGLELQRGRTESALAGYRRAAAGFAEADMAVQAAAMRLRAGRLTAGSDGAAQVAEAEAALAAAGVTDLPRALFTLAPAP